jgi:ketosteroid isomerase-like protein
LEGEEEAMSQQNERAGREIAEGVSQRDLTKLQANCADDFENSSSFTTATGKTYRGKQGWAAYLADVDAAWEELQVEIEEMLGVGADTVVAAVRVRALARESRQPIDEKAFTVAQFRDGKAIRAHTYPHRPEALRAAGLPR